MVTWNEPARNLQGGDSDDLRADNGFAGTEEDLLRGAFACMFTMHQFMWLGFFLEVGQVHTGCGGR